MSEEVLSDWRSRYFQITKRSRSPQSQDDHNSAITRRSLLGLWLESASMLFLLSYCFEVQYRL